MVCFGNYYRSSDYCGGNFFCSQGQKRKTHDRSSQLINHSGFGRSFLFGKRTDRLYSNDGRRNSSGD